MSFETFGGGGAAESNLLLHWVQGYTSGCFTSQKLTWVKYKHWPKSKVSGEY